MIVDATMPNGSRDAGPTGRDRVMAEARRLFMERGYSDVSMQQIADAAELRKATLYHHFRDKNALFTAIVLEEMRRSYDALDAIVARGGGLRSVLEALAVDYLQRRQADLMRLARDYREHVPESEHEEVHAELRRLVELFEQPFSRAGAVGTRLAIPSRLAGAFFFQMLAALMFHFEGGVELGLDPPAAAKLVATTLLDGVLTPGSE